MRWSEREKGMGAIMGINWRGILRDSWRIRDRSWNFHYDEFFARQAPISATREQGPPVRNREHICHTFGGRR